MHAAPAFYLDENVDVQVAERLGARGIDILTTQEAQLIGAAGEAQLKFATERGRVLFTHDIQDFLLLSQRWASEGREHAGLLYSSVAPPATLCFWITQALELYPSLRNLTLCLPLQP